jgi:hypothetical protein
VLHMETDFRVGFINLENARQFLSNPMNWLFAYIKDGRIIGFAYGYELNRLNNIGNMLYIHEVGSCLSISAKALASRFYRALRVCANHWVFVNFFCIHKNPIFPTAHCYESVGGNAGDRDSISYYFNILE